MSALTEHTEKKPAPQIRFMGFSGALMIFSDSPLLARKDERVPPKTPPKKR
jgi:hypothetical protein